MEENSNNELNESTKPAKRMKYASTYTETDLEAALTKIQSKQMSYGVAAEAFKIPRGTLHRKNKNPVKKRRGATTKLSKVQEDELAQWVLLYSVSGDPRTKYDIQIAAGDIAKLDENPSKHFKNAVPTSGWVEGFLKRNPELVYRTPEVLSKSSSINTKEDFAGLWRNIHGYLENKNQLDILNKPEQWWNADETGFEKDVLPRKVVARKGAKNVYRREQGKPKDQTTVTYAFSAAGRFAEPLITLKDSTSTIADIAFALGSVNANYGLNQTESGWTQSDSFYYFVTMHLNRQWSEMNIPKPIVLVIDGYKAHMSLRLFRWCRLNDVIIVVLYPGGTPFLQMCDTTMFKPLKEKHVQLYSQWRLKNPDKLMNEVEFVKLLKMMNDEVIRKEIIINGWRATGLQPFNFNNLNVDSLLSKSPDYLYNYKGDILNLPDIEMSNLPETVSNSQMSAQDETSNYDNICEDDPLYTCESTSAVNSVSIERLSILPNSDEEESNSRFDDDGADVASTLSIPRPSSESNSLDFESQDNAQGTSDTITLTSLSNQAGRLFRSFDTNFQLSDFGAAANTAADQLGNGNKITTIIDRMRRDIRDLSLLLAANDKEKLLNILVMNQQLNFIQSTYITTDPVHSSDSSNDRTLQSILAPPTMPQRAKPKTKRNLKVGYGVVTSDEIYLEEAAISKNAREALITRVNSELVELRTEIKKLRLENVSITKNFSRQERKNDQNAKSLRMVAIKNTDDKIEDLRRQINELKSIHVSQNKEVAHRKRLHLEAKKQRNVIQPLIPFEDDV